MHTNDAKALKLADGDRIAIETDSGSLEILLRVTDNMAGGILVVPRFHGVNWQIFSTGNVVIGKEKIKKVG